MISFKARVYTLNVYLDTSHRLEQMLEIMDPIPGINMASLADTPDAVSSDDDDWD